MSNSVKRILVYGLVASKTFGGVGSFLTEMNRHMSGNTVFDYVIEGSECSIQDRIEASGGKIYYIPKRTYNPIKNLQANKKVLKELRKTHDTVYFNLSTLGWIEPVKMAVKLGYHVVLHSHNSRLLVDDFKHRLVYKINKARLSHFNATRLSCSKKATEYMYSQDNTVEFIHNAVDIDTFRYNPDDCQQIRRELNISEGTKIIGFVGRLCDQKNVLFLPDILAKVKANSKDDVAMIVIGEGNQKKQLTDKIEQLNLQKDILLLGDRADVCRYYNAFNVFVLPSLYEGLPIVMVEAQVSGLPCLVSDTITSESDISGNVTFLPVNDVDKWSEAVSEKLSNLDSNRELYGDKLKDSDFDIKHEALRLEGILRGEQG